MKKFKKIYIEITNSCNLNCSFCPKHKRKPQAMSVEEFSAVIAKTKDYGDNFYLHVMGEPLSHKNFGGILKVCSDNKIKTNITTNGTLLKVQGDVLLENAVRMVSVSLHSFEANAMNGALEEYLREVLNFCKKSLRSSTIVELRLWNMDRQSMYDRNKLNCQIIEFLQEGLDLGFDLAAALEENFYSAEQPNRRKRNLKLTGNIYLGMAEHFQWPDITKSTGAVCSGFCYGLRNQVAILADGTLVPCCLDSEGNIPLGNIFTSSLEAILSKPRSVAIYNGFTERRAVEPLCQTCGYMKKFI
ncbi:MAG: radical SAM protein [Oscillospiraceae bacterium]